MILNLFLQLPAVLLLRSVRRQGQQSDSLYLRAHSTYNESRVVFLSEFGSFAMTFCMIYKRDDHFSFLIQHSLHWWFPFLFLHWW